MSVNNEDIFATVRDSTTCANDLLAHLTSLTDSPTKALAASLLVCAVLAKHFDLPRAAILEGIAAAFDSLEEATHHEVH